MLNLQRKHIEVQAEARIHPRIEWHYPVVIIGVDTKARIVDFSASGFYIETRAASVFQPLKRVTLALRLPADRSAMMIKVEVIHLDKTGFGCRFIDLNPQSEQLLAQFFDLFSTILPID